MAWAASHAIRFEPLDGATADIEKLAPLDRLIADKRIVYLGEQNHYIHEKYDYRLLLLRYLVSRGWRYIGEEMGRSDGLKVDRDLATGDESHLDRVSIYGYRGAVRTDRDDTPTGILKDSWSASFPEKEFKAEQVAFARALRTLNAALEPHDKLHFFGFDIDHVPGGGYEDIAAILDSKSADPVVGEIRRTMERVPREPIADEIARLDRAASLTEKHRSRLEGLLGFALLNDLRQSVLTLSDSFEFLRVAGPATDWTTLNDAMAARESVMHRQMEDLFARAPRDAKIVLMSHNLHLAKNFATIRKLPTGAYPGGNRVPPLGTFIDTLANHKVFSTWMLYDRGRDSQPYTWLSRDQRSRRGSLNSILASVGSAFLLHTHSLDLNAALLRSPLDVVAANQTCRTVIADQTDAIFFVREVSPLVGD